MLKEMMPKNMKNVSIFVLLFKKLEIGLWLVIIMYKLLFIKKKICICDYIIGYNQVIMYKYLKIFLVVKFNLTVISFKFLIIGYKYYFKYKTLKVKSIKK